MLNIEILIPELLAIDGHGAGSIVVQEITACAKSVTLCRIGFVLNVPCTMKSLMTL